MKTGQLVQVTYRDKKEAWWYFGIVKDIFDDRCVIKLDNGKRFMFVYEDKKNKESELINDQEVKTCVTELLINEKPVFAKRSLFGLGRYLFPKSH